MRCLRSGCDCANSPKTTRWNGLRRSNMPGAVRTTLIAVNPPTNWDCGTPLAISWSTTSTPLSRGTINAPCPARKAAAGAISRQRIILHGHQCAVHGAEIFYVIACLNRDGKGSLGRSDFQDRVHAAQPGSMFARARKHHAHFSPASRRNIHQRRLPQNRKFHR